jgi:hypothetical protein
MLRGGAERLGNGVEAARPERMTPSNARDREPPTAQRAVPFEGLDRICGAGRIIPACPAEDWRQQQLIAAHERNERGARQPANTGTRRETHERLT